MIAESDMKDAQTQLERVLAFVPRVESKASVVLGINLGMLALLANHAPAIQKLAWWMLFVLIPVFILAHDLYQLYKTYFPNLAGGSESLTYFGSIAGMTESSYLKRMRDAAADEYYDDVLAQIHRNSQIVKEKYDHLQNAFLGTAIAVFPWLVSFAALSAVARA